MSNYNYLKVENSCIFLTWIAKRFVCVQLLLLTKFWCTKLSWTMLELWLKSSLNMCIKPSHVANPFGLMDCLEKLMKSKTLSNPTPTQLPCTKRFESSVSPSRMCYRTLGNSTWVLTQIERLAMFGNDLVYLPTNQVHCRHAQIGSSVIPSIDIE